MLFLLLYALPITPYPENCAQVGTGGAQGFFC